MGEVKIQCLIIREKQSKFSWNNSNFLGVDRNFLTLTIFISFLSLSFFSLSSSNPMGVSRGMHVWFGNNDAFLGDCGRTQNMYYSHTNSQSNKTDYVSHKLQNLWE